MHYEINVSRDGKHYFGTAKRSLRDIDAAAAMMRDMRKRFPEDEGFALTLKQIQTVSVVVDVEQPVTVEGAGTRPEVVRVHHRGAKDHINYYVTRRDWEDEDITRMPTYSHDGRLLLHKGEPIMAGRSFLTVV